MNHFFHLLPFLLAHILIAHILVKSKPALLILVLLPYPFLYLIKTRWLDPWRIRRKLRSQGIDGPRPSLLHGNLPEMQKLQGLAMAERDDDREFVGHDYASTLFPYFEQWRKRYGPIYMYSAGGKQHLYVNDPELVKEMNQCLSSELGKPSYITKRLAPMLGNGILRSNGHAWAQQRKILAPQFFMDKVKGMVGLMVESAESLTAKWDAYIDSQQMLQGCCNEMVEISVAEDLRSVSADVISKACFGSSYLKGKAIFSKLRTLQKAITEQSFLFGSHAFGLAPRGHGKKIEHLEKEIETLIWETVKDRTKAGENNKDLMQLILEGAVNSNESTKRSFIVDNCKNIYFAGHESTAVAASWCFMLLALHPQWQTRIRDEVAGVQAADGGVDADSLHKLKTVTMVIKEVLRLYPPAAFVSREALRETVVGRVVVPKGVCLWTLIPTLHRDCDIWGADANEFNPERFANGISGACKVPQVYIPFGLGPRVCLGRNFAMAQLKIVVAVVVSRFSFALSPEYRHSPAYRMIVEPGEGVQLLIKKCGVNRGDNS